MVLLSIQFVCELNVLLYSLVQSFCLFTRQQQTHLAYSDLLLVQYQQMSLIKIRNIIGLKESCAELDVSVALLTSSSNDKSGPS